MIIHWSDWSDNITEQGPRSSFWSASAACSDVVSARSNRSCCSKATIKKFLLAKNKLMLSSKGWMPCVFHFSRNSLKFLSPLSGFPTCRLDCKRDCVGCWLGYAALNLIFRIKYLSHNENPFNSQTREIMAAWHRQDAMDRTLRRRGCGTD